MPHPHHDKPPVSIASDHAGRELKALFVTRLDEMGYEALDFGVAMDQEKAAYPPLAQKVAKAVQTGLSLYGVLICGTGLGMSICANRFKGVRAALCTSEFMARAARAHNDANILALGQRVVGPGLALSILEAFINTPFEGGRHQERLDLFE
jgi:ribose 5-phosphate isomerase B